MRVKQDGVENFSEFKSAAEEREALGGHIAVTMSGGSVKPCYVRSKVPVKRLKL